VRNDAVLPIGRQLLIARGDTGGPVVGSFYQIAALRGVVRRVIRDINSWNHLLTILLRKIR